MPLSPHPCAALLARGISASTLASFDVQRRGPSWIYPVRLRDGSVVAWRRKRCDGGRPKYLWDTTRLPARPDVLYAVGCITPGRPVILCAGEPDCWLLHTLGVPACTFLCGEGTVPSGAVQHLVEARPSVVIVLYDRDAVGQVGAVGRSGRPGVVQRLRDAGQAAVALALPDTLPIGGDLTDLYAACSQDRSTFLRTLQALPPLPLPRLVSSRRQGSATPRPRGTGLSPYQRFKMEHRIEDVIGAMVRLQPRGGGRYLVGRCPFHDDHTPSFAVYPADQHFHCYGCGRHGDVITFVQQWQGGHA